MRGIHIRRRADEIASVQNEDAIVNVGLILGRDSVAVFDSVGSRNDGERGEELAEEVSGPKDAFYRKDDAPLTDSIERAMFS